MTGRGSTGMSVPEVGIEALPIASMLLLGVVKTGKLAKFMAGGMGVILSIRVL